MPQLLEAGKVYRAVPPLYGVNRGKNKTDYFTDRIDIVRYIQKEFSKTNKISFNGKPLTSKELFLAYLIKLAIKVCKHSKKYLSSK